MFLPPRCVSSFVPKRLSVASADLFRVIKESGASSDDAAGDSFSGGAIRLGIRRRTSAEIVGALLDDQRPADNIADVEDFVDDAERGAAGVVGDDIAEIAGVT